MEAHSMELTKVCKKMHKHVFDGENIDVSRVMKDVYENFTWIFKATISQIQKLENKFQITYDREIFESRKALGFLITFSRCMLKRCVEEGTGVINRSLIDGFLIIFSRCMLKRCVEEDTGVINRSLIDILTDVESHFVDLLEYCTSQLSREELRLSQQVEILRTASFEHMQSRVSNAIFLAVFSSESAPPSTRGFVHSDESMVEFLDQVLENLSQCNMEDQNIKTCAEKLEFLRDYLQFTKDLMSREGRKELLVCVEVVVENAACYSYMKKHGKFSSRDQYLQIENRLKSIMGVGVLKALVLKLQDSTNLPPFTDGLLKGYVDCVQENLTELLNDDLTTPQVKSQFEDLHKQLKFLAGVVLSYPPKHEAEIEKLSDIRKQFQTLLRNVGSVVFFSLNERTTLGISDLLEKANILKEHIRKIFSLLTFGRVGRNSPKTNQLGFLNSLIENFSELKDFQSIHRDLVSFRSILQNTIGNSYADDDESKDISNRIRFLSYEAEYFINSDTAGVCPDWCRSLWFPYFEEQVKLINKATIADKKANDDKINIDINDVDSSKNPIRMRSLALVPTTDVVVGFEDEMEIIKERLISDSRKLDVVSIFGMGGLGKTTLAKKVYEDPSIVDHFQFRAWCCVSQEYNKKELLLTLLGSIIELTDLMRRKSHGDLSVMLHKQLTGNRYLIVMDDIWEMDAFKDLKRFFPDNGNGSRIMLTSRNRLEDYIDPLGLRFLTDDESWDLLKQKVYQKEEECSSELSQVGREIAEKCRGLPLAIVVVAGILAKSEKKLDLWEQVAGNLSTYIAGDTQVQVMAALELSYEFLPDQLKPLFLYLGAFPEDKEIPTNKLTWLWIAEGFVDKTDDQLTNSLELQAEINLMDLIDRSLVMIAERRSDGRVRSCRVHDLLRDMCLGKAKEENFMRHINVQRELPDPVTYGRRLSISLNKSDNALTPERPFVVCEGLPLLPIPPPLRSFLFFVMKKTLPAYEENIDSVFGDFRLLRIMHSESNTLYEEIFRDHVVMLIHLRYISIRAIWNLIPSSISKLRNLETLIIKGLRGEIVMPEEIWEMVKLRHLHVNDRADFSGAVRHQSSSKLKNLQTLSTPAIYCESEKWLIPRMPNLRKLRCIFVEDRNFYRNFYQLAQLESLKKLESLKMLCYGRMPHSGEFGLPSTLKKLTLSKFKLQWSEISSFQKLPNLEVLKLRGGAVEGELWDTGDGEFPKLKFLKLESLNIKQWIVSAENFPCLKKLVFKSCKKLEEIPSSVGDFYSLEKIEVVWCSLLAAKSAKLIQEEQKDAGNELLKVQISISS